MQRNRTLPRLAVMSVCFCTMALAISVAVSARADDFDPPPWDRGDPTAMTAEWGFQQSQNPAEPDGPLTDLSRGGGHDTVLALEGEFVHWDDGWWTFPHGGIIEIEMDNVIDFEPWKDLWLQVTYTAGPAPELIGITAFDNEVGFDVVHTLEDELWLGDHHYRAHLRLWPNPDWERIGLEVRPGVAVGQVLIDTRSVPEPSTLVLLIAGVLGLLAGMRCRRRKRG